MPSKNRNAELDGMRGYAALCVVFYHSILGLDSSLFGRVFHGDWGKLVSYDLALKIALTVFNGQAAVILFFIISGAVLSKGLSKEEGPLLVVSGRFLVRRFFRIYPALFVGVLACAAAFKFYGMEFGGDDIVANLLLYRFPINGATWTLQVELIASVFLVLCFGGFFWFGEWGAVAVGMALVVLFDRHMLGPVDDNSFRAFWFCFVLGMLVPTRLGKWIGERSPIWVWPVFLILTLATRKTLQELSAGVLINLLYYGRAGVFSTFLRLPLSQFLGRISYSFYLLNVLFLEIICSYLRAQPWAVSHPLETGLCAALIIVALTIPTSYFSWLVIEKPANRIGHLVSEKWRVRSSASSPQSA